MSTRCQLFVKNSDVVLYRHSDGYPESESGVLACILPFLADFYKYRGNDSYYCSAQLLGHLIETAHRDEDALMKLRKQNHEVNLEDYKGSRFLGFGVKTYTIGNGQRNRVTVLRKRRAAAMIEWDKLAKNTEQDGGKYRND